MAPRVGTSFTRPLLAAYPGAPSPFPARSFYLPVACGFILAGGGFSDESTLKDAEDICVLMGEYFQVQDDYLDAYAPPEVLGKIGTDIQDNKCSWLVVQVSRESAAAHGAGCTVGAAAASASHRAAACLTSIAAAACRTPLVPCCRP